MKQFFFLRSVSLTRFLLFRFTSIYFPVLASTSANNLCVVNRTSTVWTCFILFGVKKQKKKVEEEGIMCI